jgi:hypothetical protein
MISSLGSDGDIHTCDCLVMSEGDGQQIADSALCCFIWGMVSHLFLHFHHAFPAHHTFQYKPITLCTVLARIMKWSMDHVLI